LPRWALGVEAAQILGEHLHEEGFGGAALDPRR
jgi:hypothetical protein